ncbi:hypothetical protein AVEN_111946-1 [Araneus ventricosus]|uniref:Uncharacterized protein n=1 Tax=Araneus ventricosus TaxID=182803 RepID=A0A4Y2S7H1_ARAVE|nr:hypothetical protein AVEN_269341-1 [Araneus ventricosus]GBN83245.1 hypothetical protein AVEN_111946-1 [Araneus ventricosus]
MSKDNWTPTTLISEVMSEPHLPWKEANHLRPTFVDVKAKLLDHPGSLDLLTLYKSILVKGGDSAIDSIFTTQLERYAGLIVESKMPRPRERSISSTTAKCLLHQQFFIELQVYKMVRK